MKIKICILIFFYFLESTKRKSENDKDDSENYSFDKNIHVLIYNDLTFTFKTDNLFNSPKIENYGAKLRIYEKNIQEKVPNIIDSNFPQLSFEEIDNCLKNLRNTENLQDDKNSITQKQMDFLTRETLEDSYYNNSVKIFDKDLAPIITSDFTCKDSDLSLKISDDLDTIKFNVDETPKSFDSKFNTFIKYIEMYIYEHLVVFHRDKYLRRIKNIQEAYVILDKFKIDDEIYYSIFNPQQDQELFIKLNEMILTFGKDRKFDQVTCDTISNSLDQLILFNICLKEPRINFNNLSDDMKKHFFYLKLNKLFKYVVDIPELVTLGGLLSKEQIYNETFVVHLIGLCLDHVEKVEYNRVFILCLIYKLFDYHYENKKFNFFLIPVYTFMCNKVQHNLYYFTWELDNSKRHSIKRRKGRLPTKKSNDHKYFKTILIIHLCQYLMMIKYNDVNVNVFKSFQEFIDKVISSNDCVGCLFDEFLKTIP